MRVRLSLAAGALSALAALASGGPAGAEIGHLRLSGSIDENLSVDNITVGSQAFRTFSWGSRYSPVLEGFVLDPRLLVFSYSGSLADQQTEASEGDSKALSIEPYRLAIGLFPSGLHSLTFRAGRSTSDLDIEAGRISTRTDTMGGGWAFRGTGAAPEASLDFARERTEEQLFTGLSERKRSTLSLGLRKSFERAQPRLAYTGEMTETRASMAPAPGPSQDGLRHRLQYDDRVRIGEQATFTPLIELEMGPDVRRGTGTLTLAGPLSPKADGSAGARYSLSETDSVTTHTAAAQGQLIERLTPDLTLTTIADGTLVTGDGDAAWGGGGVVALRAVPFTHLSGVADYGLQLSGGETTAVSHRGHLNLASTVVPRHTITGDYFLSVAQTAGKTEGAASDFRSHTATLGMVSQLIPLSTASAAYSLEMQQGLGERLRQSWTVSAETRPHPAITGRGSAEYFSLQATGGRQSPQEESGVTTEAGVTVRAVERLELSLAGRYGLKEVSREDRVGPVESRGVTASLGLSLGALVARGEGFAERDQDARQERYGGRGSIAYRFRVWTITGEFEMSQVRTQGLDVGRERALLRISRPLNFSWP